MNKLKTITRKIGGQNEWARGDAVIEQRLAREPHSKPKPPGTSW